MKNIVILLAAGKGNRMHSKTEKQFLLLEGKPLLYYSLQTFEKSGIIDEIILVTGEDRIDYVRAEIVDKYGFYKVSKIVSGGSERYLSVWNGLKEIRQEEGNVFIHDGARAFVTEDIIERAYDCVQKEEACVVGIPSKDTVKISDENGFVRSTPKREEVWIIQTPQVFKIDIAYKAYEKLIEEKIDSATDDAMVVESMFHIPVRLVMGSEENIKITTPNDMEIGSVFLKRIR